MGGQVTEVVGVSQVLSHLALYNIPVAFVAGAAAPSPRHPLLIALSSLLFCVVIVCLVIVCLVILVFLVLSCHCCFVVLSCLVILLASACELVWCGRT